MPALLEPLAAWLAETAWPAVLGWITTVLWPAIVSALRFLGLTGMVSVLWKWLMTFMAERVIQNTVAVFMVTALMVAWGVFLFVFWNWVSGNGLKELFSTNPLSGAPAGALYLASHAFPLKFFFGTAIAYIQWRLTVIQAAIVLNRIVKLMIGI